jgi:formate hydrogenlyase transcriptional activator
VGAYDEIDLEFAQPVATQLTVALDKVIHLHESRYYQQQPARERDTLRLMVDVNNAVASHLDLRQMLKTTASLTGPLICTYESWPCANR